MIEDGFRLVKMVIVNTRTASKQFQRSTIDRLREDINEII